MLYCAGGGLVWTVSGGSGATPGTDLQSPDGAYGPWSIDVEQVSWGVAVW
jgi:hypothetical protein